MKNPGCFLSCWTKLEGVLSAKPRLRLALTAAFWVVATSLFVLATLILVTRFVIFPKIDSYNDAIEHAISKAWNVEVRISQMVPSWERVWPRLTLKEVTIKKPGTEKSLTLPSVNASFYWGSLLGKPQFKSLEVINPSLEVTRLSDTLFSVAGYEIDTAKDNANRRDGAWLDFLLDQGRLDITQAHVQYIDKRGDVEHKLEVTDFNATFAKHIRHWDFGLQAKALGKKIDFRAELRRPFGKRTTEWREWTWSLYSQLDAIDLEETRPWLGNLGEGIAAGQIWASFEKGKLASVQSDLVLSGLATPTYKDFDSVAAKRLELQAKAKIKERIIDLTVDHFAIESAKAITLDSLAGALKATFNEDRSIKGATLTLEKLNLKTARDLLKEYALLDKKIATELERFSPTGVIANLTAAWSGDYKAPTSWALKTDFENFSVLSQAKEGAVGIPGAKDLTGSLEITPTSGSLDIDNVASLTFPGVFENETIAFTALEGKANWKAGSGKTPFTVELSDFIIVNDDLSLTLKGSWNASGGVAGTADFDGQIKEVKATSAWRYIPKNISEGTRHWLEGALRGGVAHDGHYVVRGPLKDFPWHKADTKKAHFLATGKITDGLLDFVPMSTRPADGKWQTAHAWPVVSGIAGTLLFEGSAMHIKAETATTLGATAKNVHALIPEMGAADTHLTIDGAVTAPLTLMSQYLEKSPVGAMLSGAFNGTKAKGDASLDLSLVIPLGENPAKPKVKGLLTFEKNAVTMAYPVPPITELSGKLTFTDSGASADSLTAQALGATVSAHVLTDADGTIRISAAGKVSPKKLDFFVDTPLMRTILSRLEGESSVAVDIRIPKGKALSVTALSNLVGVKSNYPAPLAKAENESWLTTFSSEPVTLRGKNARLMKLTAANKVDLIMQFEENDSGLPALGGIGIGKKAGLPNAGLVLEADAQDVNFRNWDSIIAEFISASRTDTKTKPHHASLTLQEVRYKTKSFAYDEIHLTNLAGRAKWRGKETWTFSIDSTEATGLLTWDFAKGPNGHVQGNFSRYHTPKSFEENFRESVKTESFKASMPSLAIEVKDLAYKDANLGALSLQASTPRTQNGVSWRIDSLRITNPDAILSAKGEWSADGMTSLTATLDLTDGGELLKRLGKEGILGKGSGSIRTSLLWKGSPWDPDLSTLQGNARIDMKRGYLAQADMGVGGAFLSLVSLQSLIKKLTLDFFDTAHTSFTFDSLTGDMLIADGILTSEKLELIGTKASITLSGLADIANSKLNAKARVVPNIDAGAASLPIAIINPIIGLGAYVGQWILSKPLNYILTTEYSITGSFDEPVISKVLKKEDTTDANQEAAQ